MHSQTQKVYILLGILEYIGSTVLGVYTSERLANNAELSYRKGKGISYDDYEILEMELRHD